MKRTRLYIACLVIFAAIFANCNSGYRDVRPIQVPDEPTDKYYFVRNPNQTEYTICLNVAARTTEEILDAIDAWNYSIGNYINLRPVYGSDCDITVRETLDNHPTDPSIVAWATDYGGNEIYLRIGKYEWDARTVMMHELGHVFGAQHTSEYSLMSARDSNDYWECPDLLTILQVVGWQRIDLEKVRYCEITKKE